MGAAWVGAARGRRALQHLALILLSLAVAVASTLAALLPAVPIAYVVRG